MNKKIKIFLLASWLFFPSFSCLSIGWELPATDLSDETKNAYRSQVAMDSAGNAVAVWRGFDGSKYIVQTRRYDEATDTWSAVTNLSAAGQNADDPQVAMDG
ncbi:hypothetical protein E3J79_00845, partial [Candidatus Dependentiae bacterium]